jgi:general secretion pathway protein E
MKIVPLEEILLASKIVNQGELDKAISIQNEKGGEIRDILVQIGAATEADIVKGTAQQWGMDFIPAIGEIDIDPSLLGKISTTFLRRYRLVPVKMSPDEIVIAINDPVDQGPAFDIAKSLNVRNVKKVLAPKKEILAAIARLSEIKDESAKDIVEDLEEEEGEILKDLESITDITASDADAPIIRLVNRVMVQAFRERASDIHVEPYQSDVKIRFRVDGILHDALTLPKRIQSAVISRVKIMASLNIAEKRLPQDGRIGIKLGDHALDLRISTVPTVFGERVVMRILDKSSVLMGLEDLGFYPDDLSIVARLIKQEHGIILVTGPTGSGKTTSLYAGLSRINSPDKNILTIEDPIEYQIKGIGQIPVNAKVGLTFASGLRSIVRQDPDVILVGEIRDLETAEIAIQSALTGHLVFSTLHTNDASSAITRLIDMGIEPFLVTSSLNAIIAQRLIRKICPKCAEKYIPEEESLAEIGLSRDAIGDGGTLIKGKGCRDCMGTGYKGRTGIYEILLMKDTMRSTILKTSDSNTIKKQAIEDGLHTLRQDGARKVKAKVTTIEEVLRVTQK